MQSWGDEQRVQEYPRQPYSPPHPGIAYGRNFPFPQLAGDRQLRLMPCCHPAGEDLHLKAFVSQDPRRSDRAAFCVSHGDDGSCPVRLKLRKSAVQLGQRNKHRPRNVASFPNKLVRVTHIEHKRWGFVSEEYLELLGRDRWYASPLPLPTPKPGATLSYVRERIATNQTLPALTAALARQRVKDARAELTSILSELYDTLARNRHGIKLLDRSAQDSFLSWQRCGLPRHVAG